MQLDVSVGCLQTTHHHLRSRHGRVYASHLSWCLQPQPKLHSSSLANLRALASLRGTPPQMFANLPFAIRFIFQEQDL